MDLKVEENKQAEDPTHEAACVGDLLGEEETKVDELLSSSLDVEHIELNFQQVNSSEQQNVESNVVALVNGGKQDLGENDEIQIDGIAAIDADKESLLVQEHLESRDGENREDPNQEVDGPTEGVGEKEFPQEELHLDECRFPVTEERDSGNSSALQISQDVADVMAVVDESTGLEQNAITESKMGITNQLAYVVTDEKDMDTKDGRQVDDFSGFDKSSGLGPFVEGDESGTVEEQMAFMKDVESFCREKGLEFKPPKFYGEGLNLLKLWRSVIRLGGYEQVTACKLWRQVGESFNPPKTCTTISWTFRIFYEKALLEYEKHKFVTGALNISGAMLTQHGGLEPQADIHGLVSGRARRDSAARAIQGWHQHRLGNGEVTETINKEKNLSTTPKREKQLKTVGIDICTMKRKMQSPVEQALRMVRAKTDAPKYETSVIDVGAPANWVKINVQKTRECFEIYALVPGLLREEVKVQSDPAGRVVISGEPGQPDNPWGVTPFKKVVTLPSRIDPHQTSAVITLHGQLLVRVPFEQPDV
uniref:Uncharacterized protein n=1 Tax=Kalanchoe fedtschenkoi TaxID=63787 RepID=A0A7N0U6D0_KALFE